MTEPTTPQAPTPDFRDMKAVEAWLREQPREVVVAIAARAALRVAPALAGLDLHGERLPTTTLTPSFRALASPSVSAMGSTHSEVAADARAAARAYAGRVAFTAADEVAADARAAAAAAFATARAAASADAAAFAAEAAAEAAAAAAFAAAAATAADAAFAAARLGAGVSGGLAAAALSRQPLWSGGIVEPKMLLKLWSDLSERLSAIEGEDWAVWLDWWEARRDGRPVDDDTRDAEGLTLEEARVLRPHRTLTEDQWKDPKTVNTLLRTIEDEFAALRTARLHAEMQARITALEAALDTAAREAPPARSHNNPPELIDDLEAVRDDLAVLNDQPVAPADASRARAAVDRLRRALGQSLGYAGAKLDVFIAEFAKEAGKSVGKVTGVGLLGSVGYATGLLAEVIALAKEWLATLGAS